MIEIRTAMNSESVLWNSFIKSSEINHHAFSWRWKEIIEEVFGQEAHYLIASENKEIVGVFPLFFFKSFLFGKSLISLPYLNSGGIVTKNKQAANALLEHAISLSKELDTKYLELRTSKQSSFESELEERTHKVSMTLEIQPSWDAVFDNFPAKLRSQIRRPEKEGLTAKTGNTEEDLDAFFTVFSRHMRDLGTPIYPKSFFSNVISRFAEKVRVISVWDKKVPTSAAITIGEGDTTEIIWAASLRPYNRVSANMLLYKQAIQKACEDGYQVFDFGRSDQGSGTHNFKKQWGAKEKQLYWYYHLNRGEAPNVSAKNQNFSILVGCWSKLPLPIANLIGPEITKSIP